MSRVTTGDAAVADDEEARRYELTLDGEVVGMVAYVQRPGTRVFTHAEIDDDREGQGLGGRLVAAALGDLRRRGMSVVPQCPFVAHYLEQHAEYADLIEQAGTA